jgi:hypothetical protein
MYRLDAKHYHESVSILEKAITFVEKSDGNTQARLMSQAEADHTVGMLTGLEKALAPLPVPVTKLTLLEAREALEDCEKNRIQFIGCAQMLLNVSRNLARELTVAKVFVMDPARVQFYEPTAAPFGPEVETKFPSIASELDSAGKCYACDLPTAAAFHWIRCLEAGLRAITACLGLPAPQRGKDRNWSEIGKSIRAAMETRWPSSTGRMSGDAKLFDKVYGALAAMQNPYRNETMHLDASYTAGEALHIFEVVKGVMVMIASRMDENGRPLA